MDTEHFRRLLLSLRNELVAAEETGGEAEGVVELDQARTGRLTRMDALQAQAMSKATGQLRRQKLLQIAAALERIENDEFGWCGECGEAIAKARLEFDPTVLFCIDCAAQRETAR
jgi:DnaK suppressor protein